MGPGNGNIYLKPLVEVNSSNYKLGRNRYVIKKKCVQTRTVKHGGNYGRSVAYITTKLITA